MVALSIRALQSFSFGNFIIISLKIYLVTLVKYSVSLSTSSQEAFELEHLKRNHLQSSTFKAVLDGQSLCFLQNLFILSEKQFTKSYSFFCHGFEGQ